MSSFEYLVALVSIVAGLGLTRALSGIATVVRARGRGKPSGVHIAWTGSVLLWLVAFWWFTFLLSSIETWTAPLLLFVLLYGSVIYFLIVLLYPDGLEAETDLFAYFLQNQRWFFGTFVALGVLDLADTWIKYELTQTLPPLIPYLLLMVSWLSLGVVGAFSTSSGFHKAFAYSWVVVMGVWVVTTLPLMN